MASLANGRTTNLAAMTTAAAVLALVGTAGPTSAQSNLDLEVRAGLAVPVGDISEVGDPGGGFGVGLGWSIHDRVALRADGDVEILSEDLAGGVVMPISYLWHLHGGLQLDLLESPTSPWLVAVRGGAGATIYDTERFFEGGDDFLDTYFSVSGALVLGRRFSENLSLGVIGQVFITYADKARTAELAARSPLVLNAFREASSFPIQAFLSWSRD